jgi:hypothetical protein
MTRDHALTLRAMLVKASASLSDKDISEAPEFCDPMKYDGSLIAYKTRINWHGQIKMAAQDLWATEENDPDHAPTLWTNIRYKDGYRYIEDNMSAADAFDLGERGWWNDILYESLSAGNVYTPTQYPQGWKEV